MIFLPYQCDFGVKIDGVAYDFDYIASLKVDDPEKNKLTRGANASNKIGLAYKEGVKEPKVWTVTIMNMSLGLKTVLDSAWRDQKRCEVYGIDRPTGSSKMAKNAILCNQPQQLSIDETAESMNIELVFETFDSNENHKE